MKKQFLWISVCLIFMVWLNACTPPAPLPEIPTATPDPNLRITETARKTDYLNRLMTYPNEDSYHSLYFRLSPNGRWVLSVPDSYDLSRDHIDFFFVQGWSPNIQVPLDNDLLDVDPTAFPPKKIDMSIGDWSPDSTAFLAAGLAPLGKQNAFLVIFDLTHLNRIGRAVVRWEYEGQPYFAWAPDSSRLLIWFGPEIPLGRMFLVTYTEKAWIVDRQGKILNDLDVEGLRSPLWVKDQLFAIKSEGEIWRLDPDQNLLEKVYTGEHPIARILDRNQENNQLLLIESEAPYDLLVFDIQSRQVVARVPGQIKMSPEKMVDCRSVPTTSHYTGIDLVGFYVFDWTTQTLKDYSDNFVSPFWSPVVNGFIVNSLDRGSLDIIYP